MIIIIELKLLSERKQSTLTKQWHQTTDRNKGIWQGILTQASYARENLEFFASFIL
jgi:hypothetical protein